MKTRGNRIVTRGAGWAALLLALGASAPSLAMEQEPVCGDGYKASVEGCDDGNTQAGDGCGPDCEVEADWACATFDGGPSTCEDCAATEDGRCDGCDGPCPSQPGEEQYYLVYDPADCGGGGPLCPDGEACAAADDCMSGVCWNGWCAIPSCSDGVPNGDETDLDCGGSCAPCEAGFGCFVADDCDSGVCEDGLCGAGACDDGLDNGDETDVDCGGSCAPCGVGQGCQVGADCDSLVCLNGACQPASCVDGVMNGVETDTDCGNGCGPCAAGQACAVAADCGSEVCAGGVCQAPGCGDGVQNGAETGLDCGGGCAPCMDGAACGEASDCQSGVCVGARCQEASCGDGVANGDEAAVDCGGACAPCATGQTCAADADCDSGVCQGGGCVPASCDDGVHNGDESDVDCGGACGPCGDGAGCVFAADCDSGVCVAGSCAAPSCGDGVVNGGEACDDGVVSPEVGPEGGDGCSASCEVEAGWTCESDGALGSSVCVAECGDGVRVEGVEECDDGNGAAGDGCADDCVVETGWSCAAGAAGVDVCEPAAAGAEGGDRAAMKRRSERFGGGFADDPRRDDRPAASPKAPAQMNAAAGVVAPHVPVAGELGQAVATGCAGGGQGQHGAWVVVLLLAGWLRRRLTAA